MASTAEKRKSTQGIVTPNSDKDAEWRREVVGIYSFEFSDVPVLPEIDISELSLSIGFSIGI